jgi:hypothetical protein
MSLTSLLGLRPMGSARSSCHYNWISRGIYVFRGVLQTPDGTPAVDLG